jgi:hypothetical protein
MDGDTLPQGVPICHLYPGALQPVLFEKPVVDSMADLTSMGDFDAVLDDVAQQCTGRRFSQKARPIPEIAIPNIMESNTSSTASRKNWARLIQKIYEVDPLNFLDIQDAFPYRQPTQKQVLIQK